MRLELFLEAWAPLTAWRRRHAFIVRRNTTASSMRERWRLAVLKEIFSAWQSDEDLRQRLELMVFAPVLPFFALQRMTPAAGAFWVLYGATTLMVADIAAPAVVEETAEEDRQQLLLSLTDMPWADAVSTPGLQGWSVVAFDFERGSWGGDFEEESS